MKININRGMYLETIINNSIDYYEFHSIAIFRKQFVPIKIKAINENEVIGKLADKCDVDYYGIFKGYFIAIEAKQTKENYFDLSNLLEHQIEFLQKIDYLNGFSFIIIYFQKTNNFYLIDFQIFYKFKIKNKSKKRIYENWFSIHCEKLILIFPGRLNIIEGIKKLKNNILS